MIRYLLTLALLATSQSTEQPATLAEAYPAARHGGPYMFNYYLPPAPSTTPWAPCWSPDGRWIAVAMHGSIWKIDPDAGSGEELTRNRGYASSPTLSSDGAWLVYTVDYNRRRIQLEALNLRTGAVQPLTDDEHVYADPVFSPDGSRLAYVSTKPTGYFNVYVRAIQDGRWAGPPIAVTTDHEYGADRLYFGTHDMHTQPAWTADGKALLLVSNRGVALGSGDLWRVPAKARGMDAAVRITREQTLYRTRPHVSPDGRRIVYSSTAGGADQFNNLYLLPASGGDPYKITFGSFDHFHPRWSPDGNRIAFISNEEGLPQLAVLETWGGARRIVRIRKRTWLRPMGALEVTISEAAAQSAVAARVHIVGSDDRVWAPNDAYARTGANGRSSFYTEGRFRISLPPGKATLTVVRGFEYEPASREVLVQAGKVTRAVVQLNRVANPALRGWYGGSTHAHMNYGGNLHNTPENLARMAAAEGLRVVNALAANKDNRVLDWQYFRAGAVDYPLGQAVSGVHVLFGEEYRPAFHGHTFLLGLRDHLITPFTTNYEGTAIDSLYPTNTDIFRKAKSQGALTGYVHPFGDIDPLKSGSGSKAVPIDAALGTLDALEWSNANRAQLPVWHRWLNNDIALVPVGGEDSINDLHFLRTLGSIRTYVHVNGPLTGSAWLDGIRKGRTFFTTGPLLDFRVNGQLPGSRIELPASGGALNISVNVVSPVELARVMLWHRRGVLRDVPLLPGRKHFRLKERIHLSQSDWIALSVEGPADTRFDSTFAIAGTNAVRIYVGRQKVRDREAAEYFIDWIERLRKETLAWPWWNSEAEKEHVLRQYQEAQRVYVKLASEDGNRQVDDAGLK